MFTFYNFLCTFVSIDLFLLTILNNKQLFDFLLKNTRNPSSAILKERIFRIIPYCTFKLSSIKKTGKIHNGYIFFLNLIPNLFIISHTITIQKLLPTILFNYLHVMYVWVIFKNLTTFALIYQAELLGFDPCAGFCIYNNLPQTKVLVSVQVYNWETT